MGNIIYFTAEGDQSLWEQHSLPIGNGCMGASMFGGVRHERIVLNEKSLWAGGPCANRPDYHGGNKQVMLGQTNDPAPARLQGFYHAIADRI